jgi:uncharacterized membrane protein YsdA (DUF1294 family)
MSSNVWLVIPNLKSFAGAGKMPAARNVHHRTLKGNFQFSAPRAAVVAAQKLSVEVILVALAMAGVAEPAISG